MVYPNGVGWRRGEEEERVERLRPQSGTEE